ncbi:hypothetical protein NPIL_268911 [Nephila pilipes]|uniref:Uncharacterized protein n=1 Tax=Nephila pilipes TaxID=299642 RepID=A0A8X6K599_NEPPI|nr:hypothetical protein NPIL_268911 [Nephila pilipes]
MFSRKIVTRFGGFGISFAILKQQVLPRDSLKIWKVLCHFLVERKLLEDQELTHFKHQERAYHRKSGLLILWFIRSFAHSCGYLMRNEFGLELECLSSLLHSRRVNNSSSSSDLQSSSRIKNNSNEKFRCGVIKKLHH